MKPLDQTDHAILNLLTEDGRMSIKDISKQLNLTPTPIFERIKKMEKSGVIDHYTVVLNYEKLGKNFHAFAHISLKDHSKEKVHQLEQSLLNIPEVVECHYVTGNTDFIIKILVENMDMYRTFVMNRLLEVQNIGKVESYLSLEIKKG